MSDRAVRPARNQIARAAGLSLLACALSFPPALTAAPQDSAVPRTDTQYWNFRVLLDGREVGFHEFRVITDGGAQQVETRARFDVKFLFFNAYRYRHRNIETWRGGCLTGIASETDANGEHTEVSGSLRADGFALDAAAGQRVLDRECVRSFAYWDPELLRTDALLNAQTGELVPVTIDESGPERLTLGDATVPVRRYRITMDDGAIDLWYHGETGRWLALEAPTEGGRTLRYEPSAAPPDADDGRLAMD